MMGTAMIFVAWFGSGWLLARYSLAGLRRYGPLDTSDIVFGVVMTLIPPLGVGGALATWMDQHDNGPKPRKDRTGRFWGLS